VSLDLNVLLFSIFTSGVGGVLFVYGRKQERPPQLVAGIILIVYPYFVSSLAMSVAIFAVIVAAMWIAIRQGW